MSSPPHQDQLRQRVAWALSQIFVVSANGFGMDDRTELWLNYYDPRRSCCLKCCIAIPA